ncbi:MAG: SEC-C domain-containing protein [Sulfuricellaceae bacterium]|nr:SEC-C domain-containing protein [Sulfuricellaceae bacterium]
MSSGAALDCPCGSGTSFAACCGDYLERGVAAPTAEALMRSRYSAYVLKNEAYLLATWHASSRPGELNLAADTLAWQGLDVRRTEAGQPDDSEGVVEFSARYLCEGKEGKLSEASRFVQEGSLWFYLNGELGAETSAKVGRNAPCPCGSGKKFKRCCA